MQYKFKSILLSTLVFSVILLLFSCALSGNGNREAQDVTFTSVGYAPIAAQKGATLDLKILNAIKASKLEAYKELAEQIHGVLLNATNSASGSSLQDDQIESRVKGLVRGARVLKSYHERDIYITELALDMKSLSVLHSPAFNEGEAQVIHAEKKVYY